MEKLTLVGIDVSARELAVAIDRGRGPAWDGTFANDATGHRNLIKRLTRRGATVRVCVESTGVYPLDLCLALDAAAPIELMVANPRATKDFARAQLRRSKTDRTDARSLLEFVRRMVFDPWQTP